MFVDREQPNVIFATKATFIATMPEKSDVLVEEKVGIDLVSELEWNFSKGTSDDSCLRCRNRVSLNQPPASLCVADSCVGHSWSANLGEVRKRRIPVGIRI